MEAVQKMMHYALMKHSGQFRKGSDKCPWGKIPYIMHPFEVMKVCSRFEISKEGILCGAIGHDLLEDCKVTEHELRFLFGEGVWKYIYECTRKEGDDATKLEKFNFLCTFERKSAESLVIKLADRFCNVSDYYCTPGKKAYASKYALQAYPLYVAFFNRVKECERFCNVEVVKDHIYILQKIIAESPKYKNIDICKSGQMKKVKKMVTK
jgi:(p)ppGpp synthase/HD superfamily hydrolase